MKRVKYEDLPPADPSILQEMLATRTPPGTKGTDKAFLEGRLTGYSLGKLDPVTRRKWKAAARRDGVNLDGKVLCSGLGTHEFDTRAWVDSRSEQIARCKELGRNLFANGECLYKAPEKEPVPEVKLAPKIVEREVNNLLRAEPGLKTKPRQELRERIIEKHAPKRGKG
jgi:hypothetical protein